MARGTLIVFEGLDRAGKSTQCQVLGQSLKNLGYDVRQMRFPGTSDAQLKTLRVWKETNIVYIDRTTPIGQMINSYLSGQTEQDDHAIHLLFTANRWEAAKSIRADIDAGITVIIDRYYYSGCVYSAAKQDPNLSLGWCREPEVGLPRPDVCIFLNISAEEAEKRGGYGQERYEKRDMQERVRDLFGELMHRKEGEDIIPIDAGGEFEDVQRAIRNAVYECIDKVDNGDIPLRTVEKW